MNKSQHIALLEILLAKNGHDQTMRTEATKALVGSELGHTRRFVEFVLEHVKKQQ